MDCKSVKKLLPELASGEICGKPVQDAEKHLSACRPCADEFAAYKEAMDALSNPHASFDAPSRLTMPDLSQTRSRRWVYVLPSAAVMVIIGLILMLSGAHQTPDVQVAVQPDVSTSKNTDIQPVTKSIISTDHHHGMVHRKAAFMVEHGTPVLKRNPTTKMAKHKTGDSERAAVIASDIRDASADRDAFFVHPGNKQPRKSGFVIVTREEVQPSSSIEIWSINHATGATTSYSAKTDSDGNEQSMLITSSKVEEDKGRDTL